MGQQVDGDDDVQSCDKSGNWVKANNLKWDQFKKENSDLDEDDLCDKFYKKVVCKHFSYGVRS